MSSPELKSAGADIVADLIRWRSYVTSQMRFDLKGRKLLILSVVDPDRSRRFLRCLCEEIL